MFFSVIGLSISFLIVIVVFQIVFCSAYGLNLFPVSGWDASTFTDYLTHATVPTMATCFVAMGYNTRFYRAVLAEESTRDHIRTARAYGTSPVKIFSKHIFRNSLIPISTRIVFSVPYVIIGGSLLVESYFSIPGIGQEMYNAISTGDQPLVKAIVALTACLYVLVIIVNDILYYFIDPRIELK
jgi:peptide/nickel transport system permease protein